jgi:signal transduction histidine kinase
MFRAARQRLVAWNVLVLSIIVAVFGGVVYAFYSSQIYNSADAQLRSQADRIGHYLAEHGGDLTSLTFSYNSPFDRENRTIWANTLGQVNATTDCSTANIFGFSCPKDAFHLASLDGVRQALADGSDLRTTSFRGEPQRVLTYVYPQTGAPLAVFQISRSVQAEENSLQTVKRLLTLGGLLGIILAGFGSFFLANRALVPIRKAFARQRQFTADASHELRTPLALIRANAEMLCRHGEQLPHGDTELISEIIHETDHLNRLVSDLLTLARADSEKVKLTTKPVDFRALVSEVHEDLQRIAESRGIGSSASLNGQVTVDGDEVRLRQLILILLDNALKYTDPGGRVDVSLEREDGHARLQIADTGIGIPAADLPRIFDRFYRVDRAREHESGGTGLGLAIAQWIVQAHHGNIKVDSELGKGTRFQIELPASSH